MLALCSSLEHVAVIGGHFAEMGLASVSRRSYSMLFAVLDGTNMNYLVRQSTALYT